MKLYSYIVLLVIAVACVFGLIGPMLISSADDAGVIAGIVLVAVAFPILFYIARKAWKTKDRKNLSRTITRILPVLALAFVAACSKVPAGNVGVKVNLLGGEKGVDTEELGVGRYWIGWNEELFIFPTFTQNSVWTAGDTDGSDEDESIAFQTVEGLSVSADIGISYAVAPDKVTLLFQKYRKGIDEITDLYLRNMVRDALVIEASTLPIEAVYGRGKADLIANVEKRVRDQVEPIGINIERVYWIGNLRLPDTVTAALDAKLAATQMAEQRRNEVAQATAEADKLIEDARGRAESTLRIARAQADANRLLAASLTPDLVRYQAIERWNGELPRMTGDAAVPFIDVTER